MHKKLHSVKQETYQEKQTNLPNDPIRILSKVKHSQRGLLAILTSQTKNGNNRHQRTKSSIVLNKKLIKKSRLISQMIL